MSLLAILLALFAEHFLGTLEEMRRFAWFHLFAAWARDRLPDAVRRNGAVGVVLIVGLPVLAAALVGYALAELWTVLGFLFMVLMLLYTFGPRDLEAEVEAFADARERGDDDSARWYAASLLDGGEVPAEAPRRIEAIIETILIQAHERVLGIVFWFLLLGPMGALLYRLSRELDAGLQQEDGELAQAASRLHYILGWVPARLCAFSYALAGSFTDAMTRWREEALRWNDENRGVLVASGCGALRYRAGEEVSDAADAAVETENVRESLSLVRRAAVVWLAVLALATLAGWQG